MRGERRAEKLNSITPERLADFLELRWRLLTSEPGNICEPAGRAVNPYSPFTTATYPYAGRLGNTFLDNWAVLRKMRPQEIVHPNPFALSAVRQATAHGPAWRCWDAAVAVPACSIRGAGVRPISAIPPVRRCNDFWMNTAVPQLFHSGPLGVDGALIRPASPWTFDLRRMRFPAVDGYPAMTGWDILEMAHALAHLRGDDKPIIRATAKDQGRTAGRLIQAVTEIIVCLAYDLPMNTGKRDDGKPGDPDLFYRTEVKSSTDYLTPVVRLPWLGRECPRFDDTLSVLLTAVFVEPHPFGFTQFTHGDPTRGIPRDTADNVPVDPEDRWCCLPTMVTVVGWDCIDMLTHHSLGVISTVTPGRDPPVNYVERAEDLLPPETYWDYLALARLSGLFAEPRREDGWRYVRDWFTGPEFAALKNRTPLFPCMSCMSINHKAKGAPKVPESPRPRPGDKKIPPEWRRWFADLRAIRDIQEKAVALCNAKAYGIRKSSRQTRLQQKTVRETRAAELELYREEAAAQKCLVAKRRLTPSEQRRYEAYEARKKGHK